MNQPKYELDDIEKIYDESAIVARRAAIIHQIATAITSQMEQTLMFGDQASANYLSSTRSKFAIAQARAVVKQLDNDLEYLEELTNAVVEKAHGRQNEQIDGTPV
jgi:hypothetical protein